MATPYSNITDKFKDKLLKDPDFFEYNHITLEEAEQRVSQKCKILLNEAIDELMLKIIPDVDFYDKNDITEVFNFDLVKIEEGLLSDIMKQKYLELDELRLKTLMSNFSNSEIEKFSPAKERETFYKMLDNIRERVGQKISHYSMIDRKTGKFKSVVDTNG